MKKVKCYLIDVEDLSVPILTLFTTFCFLLLFIHQFLLRKTCANLLSTLFASFQKSLSNPNVSECWVFVKECFSFHFFLPCRSTSPPNFQKPTNKCHQLIYDLQYAKYFVSLDEIMRLSSSSSSSSFLLSRHPLKTFQTYNFVCPSPKYRITSSRSVQYLRIVLFITITAFILLKCNLNRSQISIRTWKRLPIL